MKQAIIITKDKPSFSPMEEILVPRGFSVTWADSAQSALKNFSDTASPVDLLVIGQDMDDMDPKECTENIARLSPMTNCAIASSMDHDQFHEDFEGLGVLMQLSTPVTSQQTLELIEILKKIGCLPS